MAQVSNLITLGIGTPGDIEHFTLVGLSGSVEPVPPAGSVTNASRYSSRYRNSWTYLFLLILIEELKKCS